MGASKFKKILVGREFEGLRLDVFLAKIQIVPTRSQALRLISENRVLLNNSPLRASYRLSTGESLAVLIPPKKEQALSLYHKALEIIFEDEDILIVNKPAGLVTHPAPGHREKTLVNILFHQKKLSPGSHPLRPGIIHRLDKDASGLLALTKTKLAEDKMIQQFKKQLVKREYWALSLRPPSPLQGRIRTRIARHPSNRKKFISLKISQSTGKEAISFYKLFREHKSGVCWIKCHLQTGRTHQIRVHLSSLFCPIAGDLVYGGSKLSFIKDQSLKEQIKKLKRIALHAHSLSFFHPLSKKKLSFKSPWPSDLKSLLNYLDFS